MALLPVSRALTAYTTTSLSQDGYRQEAIGSMAKMRPTTVEEEPMNATPSDTKVCAGFGFEAISDILHVHGDGVLLGIQKYREVTLTFLLHA
eukprot:4113611-Amphidinium_carterae.1